MDKEFSSCQFMSPCRVRVVLTYKYFIIFVKPEHDINNNRIKINKLKHDLIINWVTLYDIHNSFINLII